MKRRTTWNRGRIAAVIAAVSAGVLLLSGCASGGGSPSSSGSSSAGGGNKVELRYASIYTATAYEDVVTGWYLDQVTKATGGRITFKRFYSGSLVATPDFPAALNDGRIDVANLVATNYASQFPLWNGAYIPIPGANNIASSEAQQNLLTTNKAFAAEVAKNGMHFQHFMSTAPLGVASQKPFSKVSDLSGLKIRANGIAAFMISDLGGNPVSVTVEEAYDALQRGTINAFAGTHVPYLTSSGLYKVAPWFNDLGIGGYNAQALAFSNSAWAKISKSDQQAINNIDTKLWYPHQITALKQAVTTGCQMLISGKGGAAQLGASESTKAQNIVGNKLWDTWRDEAVKSGVSKADADGFEKALKSQAISISKTVKFDDGVKECAAKSQVNR